MNHKERLRLSMYTQIKSLDMMLYRISKATKGLSHRDRLITDDIYERVEAAMLNIEEAQKIIEELD